MNGHGSFWFLLVSFHERTCFLLVLAGSCRQITDGSRGPFGGEVWQPRHAFYDLANATLDVFETGPAPNKEHAAKGVKVNVVQGNRV